MTSLDAWLPPSVERDSVERYDLDRDRRLVATVGEAPRQRWFRRESDGWLAIRPSEDPHLPFARELDRLESDGTCSVLSWKPGRRLTLAAAHGDSRAIYKAHRRTAHAEALARHVGAELALRDGGFVCPMLLAHSAASSLLVFEHLDGRALTIGATDPERFRGLGRSLRRMQAGRPAMYLPLHGPGEELRTLERMRARTLAIAGDEPAGAARLLQGAARLAPSLPACAPVIAHRDLHDGQFLVCGERLALLDFDLFCLADPALDAANLGAHLELRALQRSAGADEESARACCEALFEGLGRNGERGFPLRALFYRGTTLLRLAWVYHARPRWAALTPALVERASSAFEAFESDA